MPTKVAAEKPTTMSPISTKMSWRNQPAEAKSTVGKIASISSAKVGYSVMSDSPNDRLIAASMNPNTPIPTPQASACGSWSPNARPTGPRRPRVARGRPGTGMPVITPRSRRAKSSTPTANRPTVTRATSPSEAHAYWPASGTWPYVQWNHETTAIGSSAGTYGA